VVAASAMVAEGHVFRRSSNGVWLTDHVPPSHLQPLP
jgi:putative RNA 2'-phosphotransferase